MPIAAQEWEDGRLAPQTDRPHPSPASGDTPRARVRSSLRANEDLAFSRAEVVRGAAARESVSPPALGRTLAAVPNQLADLRADFEDGGINVAALSGALADLRADGVVTCRRIGRGDGELAVYYRSTER